jgi:hypothetical protein
VASPAIGGRAGRDGIRSNAAAIRMTTANYATGERCCPCCRSVDRAGVRESMLNSARNVDRAVHVLRGIDKARVRRIDVSVAVFTDRARCEAGMDGVRGREAVAGAASCRS